MCIGYVPVLNTRGFVITHVFNAETRPIRAQKTVWPLPNPACDDYEMTTEEEGSAYYEAQLPE